MYPFKLCCYEKSRSKIQKQFPSLKHELLEGKHYLPGTPVYIVYTNDM